MVYVYVAQDLSSTDPVQETRATTGEHSNQDQTATAVKTGKNWYNRL